MHASYSELQDFITYIKPKRIVPCVIPCGDSSLTDVCTRYTFMRLAHTGIVYMQLRVAAILML